MSGRRRLGADGLVVALGAAFATVVVGLTSVIVRGVAGSGFGANPVTVVVLGLLTVAFVVVATVVTTSAATNSYVLVAASQAREVALRRLLGATAAREHARLVSAATRRALLSTVVGAAAGLVVAAVTVALTSGRGGLFEGLTPTAVLQPLVIVPLVLLVLSTRRAAQRGFEGVLRVTPATGLDAAQRQHDGQVGVADVSFRGRGGALLLTAAGLLVLGVAVGFVSPFAVLIAMVGGALAAAGVLATATPIITTVVRVLLRAFGRRSAVVRVAGRNLLQYPVRSGRAGVGVLISTTVLTMFAVASASMEGALRDEYRGTTQSSAATEVIDGILPLLTVLTLCIAAISAVGLADTIALGARLRQRDLAVLRILGLSVRRSGRMLLAETGLLVGSATLAGLVVGALLGWAGVQTLLSSTLNAPLVVPLAPVWFVPVVAVVVSGLTVVLARRPVRRAGAVPPSQFLTRSLQESQ
ncbi:FtsX-like permease family protein [Curtobacterium sp. 22159]|uniref:FtsX-like permease family protein n=1 Tax=Curtobacterium sp. 22159 TaxID=3453882 RepID=UPI003F84B4BC